MDKINWRKIFVKTMCPNCINYDWCGITLDCEALKFLVELYEDMDNSNTGN